MRPRVLIFEDNDILRSALEYILQQKGYEVFTFSDPKGCPTCHSTSHTCPKDYACADIIISDVNMPSKTGIEFIKERQQKGCKVKYRALMSGDWTESDLKDAQEFGCFVLHKPFDIKKMLNWLDNCAAKINPERKLIDLCTKR